MNTIVRLLATACLFTMLSNNASAEYVAELTQQQAQEKIKAGSITTIDVRSAGEYSAGHVPGAINVPHDAIASQLEQIKHLKGQPVMLYCRSGRRAEMAETTLSELGFSQIYHLQGDMMEWDKNQLPIEK